LDGNSAKRWCVTRRKGGFDMDYKNTPTNRHTYTPTNRHTYTPTNRHYWK